MLQPLCTCKVSLVAKQALLLRPDMRFKLMATTNPPCRLFHQKVEFETEVALYRDPLLKQLLPDLLDANENADGKVRSRSGVPFAPYMVLERGAHAAAVCHSPARSICTLFFSRQRTERLAGA